MSFKCDFQFGFNLTRHLFDMIRREGYYHYFLIIVLFLMYEKIAGLLKIRLCICSSLKSNLGIITYGKIKVINSTLLNFILSFLISGGSLVTWEH